MRPNKGISGVYVPQHCACLPSKMKIAAPGKDGDAAIDGKRLRLRQCAARPDADVCGGMIYVPMPACSVGFQHEAANEWAQRQRNASGRVDPASRRQTTWVRQDIVVARAIGDDNP